MVICKPDVSEIWMLRKYANSFVASGAYIISRPWSLLVEINKRPFGAEHSEYMQGQKVMAYAGSWSEFATSSYQILKPIKVRRES